MKTSAKIAPQSEIFFFNENNFLAVARKLFRKDALRVLRSRIAEKAPAIVEQTDDKKNAAALELGIAPDQLRLHREWYDIWMTADISMLRKYAAAYDQIVYPPQIRTVREKKAFVAWHQDDAYMRALGARAHKKIITCFVPLDDEPGNRPTVQFFINPGQTSITHTELPGAVMNKFDIAEKDKPPAEQCVSYKLNLGDAFIFGKLVLHRTYFEQDAFPSRQSMEFRLTTKDSLIGGKDYYDLKTHTFYLKE